ncbi:MAG: cupin domain-containing protein [Candidatus Pacebacteria bacterium]|jgi:mannose-6-phosphate isomerase-like protein (cupin superfamily)|nr:cupin domain-containing protein [Candidatus Paceibacterota bacterium]
MKGYITNIEETTKENNNFRKVLYTGKNSQLVVMSIAPGDEIGEEIHDLDQFIRIEQGEGRAILDGVEHEVKDDFAIVVPAGANHNIINTSGEEPLKLYTVYSPPEHKDKIIHETREDALNDKDDHFDGVTTE